jgi:hypothetical protein
MNYSGAANTPDNHDRLPLLWIAEILPLRTRYGQMRQKTLPQWHPVRPAGACPYAMNDPRRGVPGDGKGAFAALSIPVAVPVMIRHDRAYDAIRLKSAPPGLLSP